MAVLAAFALAGLAGCGTQAWASLMRRGLTIQHLGGTFAGAVTSLGPGANTAPGCRAPTLRRSSSPTNVTSSANLVPAAAVAAAGAVAGAGFSAGSRGWPPPATAARCGQGRTRRGRAAGFTVCLLTGNDGTTQVNPIMFEAYPWQNEKLCIYGSAAPHQVAVDVAGDHGRWQLPARTSANG